MTKNILLEITFCCWIYNSGFYSHRIHVIISEMKMMTLLTGSSNMCSHPPVHYYSHHMGVLQDKKVFLPSALVAEVWPDPDDVRWIRPKRADTPVKAAPRGLDSYLLRMETSVLSQPTLPGESNVPGCLMSLVSGR